MQGEARTMKKPKPYVWVWLRQNGAPGRIRTSDLQVRSLLLYPAGLLAHSGRNFGAPGRIRTSDLQVRSLLLYPAGLLARIVRERLIRAGGPGVKRFWTFFHQTPKTALLPALLQKRRRNDAKRKKSAQGLCPRRFPLCYAGAFRIVPDRYDSRQTSIP